MMENENVAYELLGISNYGEFEEAQELLRSNRTNNKEDAKKNQENDLTAKDTAGHQRRPKSRKNNRGIRGNCVIIPPEFAYDADFPSPLGRAQALMPSNSDHFDNTGIIRRELEEINSKDNRNESIEDHYNSIRYSDEDDLSRYSDAETQENQLDDRPSVTETNAVSTVTLSSSPKEPPPRKPEKRDKKSRNALLASLIKGFPKKSEDVPVKINSKSNDDPSIENLKIDADSKVESEQISSSFAVDDSVDKVKVPDHVLSELEENIFSTGQNESEDDFFSARETLTSPEPNGSKSSSRKKGYHGTSRRGLLTGATGTTKKVSREKKKKYSKIDLNELPPNRKDGSYNYEPSITDLDFKLKSSDFPPL